MSLKKICFISDAHFGIDLPGFGDRERLFIKWLRQYAHEWSDLYIVGDLFDFWIEYRHAIRPDYFMVLHHLSNIIELGVAVHYLAGNHDFALGPFLGRTLGINTSPGAVERELQGRKVHLYHGDGLVKKDIGYTVFKKMLRNPLNQRIYKLLHPDIGVPLGNLISGSSRKYLNKPLSDTLRDQYRAAALNILENGRDLVIYGHIHQPDLVKYPCGTYCNIGSWLNHYTYAVMESGSLRLLRYREGEDHPSEELPAIELKCGSS